MEINLFPLSNGYFLCYITKSTRDYDFRINIFAYIDTIYPTPPLGQDMTQGQFLSGV